MKNLYGGNLLGRIKIVLVDPDQILRESYAKMFEKTDLYWVVGQYELGSTALKELGRKRPDVLISEFNLLDIEGPDFFRNVRRIMPKCEILVHTATDDQQIIFDSFKAGAAGYVTKSGNYQDLIYHVKELMAGGAPLTGKIARTLISYFYINPDSPLSSREYEVLTLMAEGKTSTQISVKLGISRETSKKHIQNIYSKLNVNRKSEALELAAANKFI